MFALRNASFYILYSVFVAPRSVLTPYCLHLGGIQGGKVFADAASCEIPGVSWSWRKPKSLTTAFFTVRLFRVHQLYSKYPVLLIPSSSISISYTTLSYLVYFFFALRNVYFYIFNYVIVATVSVLLLYCLHLPYECCGMGTSHALCHFSISVCHRSSQNDRAWMGKRKC